MQEILNRLTMVRAELTARELDAIVIHQAENRRYLTGFTGTAGTPLVTGTDARLLADSRYYERARREAPDFDIVALEGRLDEALARMIGEAGAQRVGFEADTVTVNMLERMHKALPDIEWVATTGVVEALRAVKSQAEIDLLRAAAKLTDEAMGHAFEIARPGMTEKALAWSLEVFMRENGAEGLAFDIIVGAGENSALPHHQSSDRPLSVGDPIVIDLGAKVDGYCGDLTRTFTLGRPRDDIYSAVFEVVDKANLCAVESLRPGMTGVELDAVARGLIADAGYGDSFGHGLGHGVGLHVHEMPRLGPLADDTPLAEGNAVTIEPGIYLPDRFGVRIEDLVIVRGHGAEVLSRASKQPSIDAS